MYRTQLRRVGHEAAQRLVQAGDPRDDPPEVSDRRHRSPGSHGAEEGPEIPRRPVEDPVEARERQQLFGVGVNPARGDLGTAQDRLQGLRHLLQRVRDQPESANAQERDSIHVRFFLAPW